MFPADFGYVRAESLDRALDLLARASAEGEDAKLLAGGQSLLPMMKLRLAAPETLIDIDGVPGLAGITRNDSGATVIGALTTYRALERHPVITARFPGIADALAVLADQQVRARGTIGGCVAHGDPAADLPAVLLALDAELTIAGPAGTRVTPLDAFLQGVFTTDLAADEIVTSVTLPAAPPGQAYEKFEQPASHLPLAGVCAVLEVNDGTVTSAKVAVTGIASRPFRALSAERSLVSAPLTPAALDKAAGTVAGTVGEGGQLLADQHASGPYRAHLARVLARRALERAAGRATTVVQEEGK
ncbi:MAG: FAD binding domain-containing protein [Trebonia sp.]